MVDLPEPEEPTSATFFPCGMVKEMWSSAGVRLPYRKVTSLNSMSPSMLSISVYSRSSSCSDS